MAFYLLQKEFLLRGYKKLPFGLTHPNLVNTDFFDKEQYAAILNCDGNTNIDLNSVSAKQKDILEKLLKMGIINECKQGEELQPIQKYVLYPATYKSSVQWSITGRCNLLCKHCFLSAPDYKGDDTSIEDCIRVLDELCECGIHAVSITGGEPLVHKDLDLLLEEINKHDLILESIYTNCLLVNEKLLDKLESMDLKPVFNISFDGVGCHDWLRGIEGMEQKTIDAIKLLKKRGYTVAAAMSLHKNNISSLRETAKLLGELGCDHLKVNGMSYQGNWLEQEDCYISDTDMFDRLLEYIPQYFEDGMPLSMQIGILLDVDKDRKRMFIPAARGTDNERAASMPVCGVIKKALYIAANGKVLPCMTFSGHSLEKNFDSIFDRPLKEIINDSYYSECANATCAQCIENNERCADCQYKWACIAGCRACACDNGKTDYYGIDENTCAFFKGGYFEKVADIVEEKSKELLFNQ